METHSPHLSLAHGYWKEHLRPGDLAIDATCGNGYDTVALAKLLLEDPNSFLIGLDIQPMALESTSSLLNKELPSLFLQRILLHRLCHSEIRSIPLPHAPRLVVYNLGYLPGADKSLTTQTETTLKSLKEATNLIADDGAISVMCYPGHAEGMREEKAVLGWAEGLDPKKWQVSYHRWLNRPASPTFIWVLKVVHTGPL